METIARPMLEQRTMQTYHVGTITINQAKSLARLGLALCLCAALEEHMQYQARLGGLSTRKNARII
jgi:hypothetical protein